MSRATFAVKMLWARSVLVSTPYQISQELKTLKMTNPKMLLILEGREPSSALGEGARRRSCSSGCIRTGAPMLMEERRAVKEAFLGPYPSARATLQDIEETLDPALEPVLLKAC